MTMITKITMMMKKAQIFAGLLEDGNCDIRHCVLYVYHGRRVAILMLFIVYCVLSDMKKKTTSYQTFKSQLFKLKYLQDGWRVAILMI